MGARLMTTENEAPANVDGELEQALTEAVGELEEADAALAAARERRKEAAAAVKDAKIALRRASR